MQQNPANTMNSVDAVYLSLKKLSSATKSDREEAQKILDAAVISEN